MEVDVLTVSEVAELMRLPRETVYRLAAEGKLSVRNFDRVWRLSKSVIEGHLRLTVYMMEPHLVPDELEVILGSSDRMTDWRLY